MESIEKLFDSRIIEKVMSLRLMDDDLMTKVFSDDLKTTEFILRILMQKDDLRVIESHGQNELHNIFGRSIKLDVLAEDSNHNLFNVEIQRADRGAEPKRSRYHAAMLDSHFLEKGRHFNELEPTYIIFITENDIWKKDLPVYEIEKLIKGTDLHFEDDLHILYVNGAYRGDDPLGTLMHDFSCSNPDEMKYEELAQKVRYYKQETEGVKTMCKAFEELSQVIGAEMVAERNIEVAETLLKQNLLPVDKIAEASGLTVEEIEEIASKLKANSN